MSSLKKQAVSGILWTFAQQFSVQLINFAVQVILARILFPEDFGLIAMITIFVSIGQALMDSGMTSSVIRMKDPDHLDYSTVFVTNFLMSIGIYGIVYFSSPFVAEFYNQYLLKDILRVFALTFVIRSFVAVHVAKLTKEMNFKTQMKLQVPSTLVGATVGITLALLGYGVWSLVWLNLTESLVFAVQNWVFIKWRPSFVFDKVKFKYHFNFGYKLTLSGLLDTIYNDAYRIVIGKYFTPAQVGYFNQAEIMRRFPVNQLSAVIGKVTYPLFSNINDEVQLKNAYKKTMKLALFITVPMMMVLIINAEELFLILFGQKWLFAVPYFQILSFASIVSPLSKYNLNILKVKGRSDLFLKLEIIKKIVGVAAIIFVIPYGLTALSISYVLVFYFNIFINMRYSGRLINYNIFEQLKDVSTIILAGSIVMVGNYYLKQNVLHFENAIFSLLLNGSIYVIIYFLLLYLFDRSIITLIINIFKK